MSLAMPPVRQGWGLPLGAGEELQSQAGGEAGRRGGGVGGLTATDGTTVTLWATHNTRCRMPPAGGAPPRFANEMASCRLCVPTRGGEIHTGQCTLAFLSSVRSCRQRRGFL